MRNRLGTKYVLSVVTGVSEWEEDSLCPDLDFFSQDELKAAFRIFDDTGAGFISTLKFRVGEQVTTQLYLLSCQNILREIDQEFSEEELDLMISEVLSVPYLTSIPHTCTDRTIRRNSRSMRTNPTRSTSRSL